MIVVASAVVALVAAAALLRPELAAMPRSGIWPSLLPLLPSFVVVMLAVYALVALLATAGVLVWQALRLRRRLAHTPPYQGPARPDWTAAFDGSPFARLAPRTALVQPYPPPADGTVVTRHRFRPLEARQEVARLFYIGAARVQFFSAVVILAAAVALGIAQTQAPLPGVPGSIPAVPAALAVAGLVLLALLMRVAVDVATEPLIEAIARLPAEPIEARLLRRAVDLLADRAGAQLPQATAPAGAAAPMQERLGQVFEEGQRALVEAVGRLSATTDGLAATTRSSVKALEAAVRALEQREQMVTREIAVDAGGLADLREAVVSLTALLQAVRSPAAPPGTALEPAGRPEREPDLAVELRKLLQEIEATG